MIDSFRVDTSFLNWTKVFIIMWAVFFILFPVFHQAQKGYLVPTTSLTTFLADVPVHLAIWFDKSSNDVLSVKEKRKRTASTCSWQDWKREERYSKATTNIYIYNLFHCQNSYFTLTGNRWSNLRKVFSPQSHSCRRKKSTFPLSLSFTGQYTTLVSIPSTTKHTFAKELLHFLFTFTLTGLSHTCCFIVHVGYVVACKTCSKRCFPRTTLASEEDLIVDCVHSCMWRHHWRLQQSCKRVLLWISDFEYYLPKYTVMLSL